jgi:hypothetical protein
MDTPDSTSGISSTISFNQHGPFYRLQRRLGLLSETDPAIGRRAALFVLVAWLPTVLLAALQGFALNDHHERAVLLDFSAYAFVIALVAFVLMEQTSDRRMAWLVTQFTARGIAPDSSRECFRGARQAMERRTGSPLAEGVILIAAYWLSYVWIQRGAARVEGGTWFGQVVNGGLELTLAGWWLLLVALPLFWFLLGRWLWRFYTWGRLLRDIARCDLRLVATHPDRCGGLAFIGQYPNTYLLFVLSLSTAVAATVLKQVVFAGASLLSFKFALLGLVIFLIVAFVLPLLAFTPVLLKLKKQGLSRYGALVSRHNLAFEARWVEGRESSAGTEEPLGSPDMSSLADLSASYALVQNIRPIPVTKQSIGPLVFAALLPLVVVAATQVPFKQIISSINGLLLL